jgi:uncharacterized protein with PQ loop repeat
MSEFLGVLGSVLSLIQNLPQLYKVRTKNTTKDLHVLTIVLSSASAFVWSAYGQINGLTLLQLESMCVGIIHFLILMAIMRDTYCLKKITSPQISPKTSINAE